MVDWKNGYVKYIVAGALTGLLIGIFLWLADRVSTVWAAVIATFPWYLFAAAIFLNSDSKTLSSFLYYLILGTIAYIFAVVAFLIALQNGCGKWVAVAYSIAIWVAVLGSLLFLFHTW
jgi:hypothetical protein